MIHRLFIGGAAVALSGCAGVHIQAIAPDAAAGMHKAGASSASGYVVYHPVMLVPVGPDKEGWCSVGQPFAMPDPSRPYLVEARSGLGKSGVDISIADGWRLSNVKDSSDNTALLGVLTSLVGLGAAPAAAAAGAAPAATCPPAIYRLELTGTSATLRQVHLLAQ